VRARQPSTTSLTAGLLAVAMMATASCTHRSSAETVAVPGGHGRGLVLTVTHVVDGDTVDVRTSDGSVERVRLLGIDTPETVKPDTPVQCFGPEASARTKALLPPGTEVVAQRDAEARDRYGRLLLYLWRRRDGLFVNASLVTDGYARILSIEPNTAHRSELGSDAARARDARIGLWGTCGIGAGTGRPSTPR
jgi:micrococcal nuclease